MPKTSKLDDRGENDLERVIEEQRNHIIVLEKLLDDCKEEKDILKNKSNYYKIVLENGKTRLPKRQTKHGEL